MKSLIPKHLVLAVIYCLILQGCDKNDNTTQPPVNTIPSELAASWTAQAAFRNGNPVLLSDALDWKSGTVRAVFVFGASGSFSYTEYSSSDAPLQVTTGTVTVNGSSVTIKFLTDNGQPIEPPRESVAAWTVTGNQLNITWTNSHGTWTLQLVKM